MKYFPQQGYEVVGFDRSHLDLTSDAETILEFIEKNTTNDDVIINAAGIVKQRDSDEMWDVNTFFPHILSLSNRRVIHITTDCVFSGKTGGYDDKSPHDCEDDYGRSKSLGEPPNLTIIRTSIIGEESNNKLSLIEWCKKNKGRTVAGYIDHQWNGVTCLELCKWMDTRIIKQNYFWKGVVHVYSHQPVTKYQLVTAISNVFNLNLYITPQLGGKCNRILSGGSFGLIGRDIMTHLKELKEFNIYE
jgi:dTDP-4-dehydrorhamnose reductase